MLLNRRRALLGLFAAPAIVAAPSLMRVSTAHVPLPPLEDWRFPEAYRMPARIWYAGDRQNFYVSEHALEALLEWQASA